MQVTPLARDGRVLVTFRLSDAFTEEIRAAIHSGMRITFVYDVELKRGTSLWLDRTIATATVMATVRIRQPDPALPGDAPRGRPHRAGRDTSSARTSRARG